MPSESELARAAKELRFIEFMSTKFMQEALKGAWKQNYRRTEKLVCEKLDHNMTVGEFLESEHATREGLKKLGFTEGVTSVFRALLEAFELWTVYGVSGLSQEAKQLLELKESQTTPTPESD